MSSSWAEISAAMDESGRWSGELALIRAGGLRAVPAQVDVMLLSDATDPRQDSLAIMARPLNAPEPGDTAARARRHDRLQKLAMDVAQRGLDLGPLGFFAQLSDVLAEIAAELHVDLVYADAFDDASGRLVELGGFRLGGIADSAAEGPDLSRLPGWVDAVTATNVLVVEDALVEDPPWLREKTAVFNIAARAMIIVPLRAGGRLLGVMSAEMVDRPRCWDDDEIGLVRQVAQVVANLLEMGRINGERDRSRAQFSAVLEHSFDGMAMLNAAGVITYANRAGGALVGVAPSELIGRTFLDLVEPDDVGHAHELFERSVDGPALGLLRARRSDELVVWVEISVTRLVDGKLEGFVVNGRDVTSRVLADSDLARRAGFDELAAGIAQRALDLGPAAFVERLGDVTAALGRMLRTDMCFVDAVEDGYLRAITSWSAPGQPVSTFAVEPVLLDSMPEWRDHLLGLRPLVVDNTLSPDYLQPDGQTPSDVMSIAYIACPLTANGLLCGVLGVSMTTGARAWSHDETALVHALAVTVGSVLQWQKADRLLRESEERLQRLVRTDALTGLANRLVLRETVDALESDPERPTVAALVMDLDRFKEANDRYGHDIGDDILCRLAARFDAIVPEGALLARTGEYEFVVIAVAIDETTATAMAAQLVAAACVPVQAGGETFEVGASVGIAMVPTHGGFMRDGLDAADQAMYEAKRLGGSSWHLGH